MVKDSFSTGGQEKNILTRVTELRELIRYHNELYHGFGTPEIPDSDFDSLWRELLELENKHKELINSDSPTFSVGSKIKTPFTEVEHRFPMQSLDNAFDIDELRSWSEKIERRLGDEKTVSRWVCELKFDGLAVSLRYEKGELLQAATRGDGR